MTVKVGIIGTSWWADAMYLPALVNSGAEVVALCGRNTDRLTQMADQWKIPGRYTDYTAMLDTAKLDAVIISATNDLHHPMTLAALERNLHVLCEKPLALNYAQAKEMAAVANAKGVKHLVPFTYRYMPVFHYLKELVDGDYLGTPYHLNLRYYAGFGREGNYMWRFDSRYAGLGAVGDIGSHFLYLAQWYYGRIKSVCAQFGWFTQRPQPAPDGQPYTQTEDSGSILLEFANGATGVVTVTTMAYEPSHFGQSHHIELHGSGGTLYGVMDWDSLQQVRGARVGEKIHELPIPDHIWGGVRRDTLHNTYRDVYRTQDTMTRHWINGIVNNHFVRPDFDDGAYVQRLLDACARSQQERRWINVEDIT
ncbi:MAG TPA: Gfo/Idh/MocA family oxidoreductase [Aggregatilineales bacterium]|nr:Gfo/Idh/MocA family oxidoreductase [Aggregatilineales bacterium]